MTDCIDCGVELVEVTPDYATGYQYENALAITLGGGYAMFFDDIEPFFSNMTAATTVFLCHDCAHKACEALPWLDKLLEPLKSHSHRQDYWDAHPDHEGWDKK